MPRQIRIAADTGMESLAGAVAAELLGPPIVGAVVGAAIAGKGRRVVGGSIGLAAGIGLTLLIIQMSQSHTAIPTVTATTLTHGGNYAISGGSESAAVAAGFTQVATNGGVMSGTWNGATGAPVPAGWTATQ